MKIAVVVLANDDICVCGRCTKEGRASSYTDMVTAVRRTWASKVPEGVKVFYIYGHRAGTDFPDDAEYRDVIEDSCIYDKTPPPNASTNVRSKRYPFAIDDCIYSDTPEGRENIYYKTIDAFEWLLENEEFDYILRTNCGTYIDLQVLANNLKNLGAQDNIYAGHTGRYSNKHNKEQPDVIEFASGSAFLVSRNLIKSLVESQRQNKVDLVRSPYEVKCIGDDVTFAKYFVYDKGAQLLSWVKRDVWELEQINSNLKNELQCYFRHTIDPKFMYGVHEAKDYTVAEDDCSLLKGRNNRL
jgi:hypothetical protein